MESSRIFVRGLPPNITLAEIKNQFAEVAPITDAKCIPQRRIGYVGYKSPADAAKAIKFFNKSFIRSSRIYVEQARPIEHHASRIHDDAANTKAVVSIASDKGSEGTLESTNKRKRDHTDSKEHETQDSENLPSKIKHRHPTPSSGTQVATSNGAGQDESVRAEVKRDAEQETVSTEQGSRSRLRASEHSQPFQSAEDPIAFVVSAPPNNVTQEAGKSISAASDEDWLRSRTSRLLGLLDEDESHVSLAPVVEKQNKGVNKKPLEPSHLEDIADASVQAEAAPNDQADQSVIAPAADEEVTTTGTGRLFIRNLSYATTEDELRSFFESQGYGIIEEVHIPSDRRSGTSKGYAYVQLAEPQAAINALQAMDAMSFQGRLLHVIQATGKKQTGLDEFAISKLPVKKQHQIRRKAEATSSTFNWNAMFMNADAVMSSISDRLGVPKSRLLDPTSSDAAVKQAHAETHIIQDTKAYLTANGVNLNAFKNGARGDTAILVKNFCYDTKASDLKALFESYGATSRLLVPPSGTIAIVEFENASDAQSAFAGLAYRKVKDSILFLEKAPQGIFVRKTGLKDVGMTSQGPSAVTAKGADQEEPIQTSTLYVRNLNFTTTTERLRETFKPLDGFLSATVKEKPDPKNSGQFLSMGFGFVEFRSKQQAQSALAAMNDYNLDGHKLLVKASHKAIDAAEERRSEDNAKKLSGLKTKVVIKNLPFEATKKDVRSLLGHYGQLRSVRVPKKFNTSARGFAFAEFVTAKEATNAVESLKDTHLLGRRLIFEFAAEETVDPEQEIARMQRKVGKQADKVALQTLTGTGRRKFNVVGDEEQ